MVLGPPGDFCLGAPWCEFGVAERRRTSSMSGGLGAQPPAGSRGGAPCGG